MKFKKKTKLVVGGLIAVSAISLLTTGFATWVIANKVLSKDDNVNVTVDTASNESIKLAATLGDKVLTLKEKDVDGKVIDVTGNGATEPDLTISFSEITVTCGYKYWNDHFNTTPGVTFTISSTDAKNKVAAEKNLIERESSETGWTYLNLDASKTIKEQSAWEDANGEKVATFKNIDFTFDWGSFFGNKLPSTFYNGIAGIENKTESVYKELYTFESVFKGSLALTLTVSETGSSMN